MRWIKRLFHYCRNRFRYSNFFTKMVALFLVAAFLPLFVCSAFLVTDTIRVSGKNTAASIRNNFQQTYTSLENRLTQVKKCADLLLNDAGINDFLRNGKNETTFWEQRTFKTDMDNTISFIENAQNIKRLRVYVDPAYFYILDSYHYCSMNLLSGQSWFTPLRLAKGRSIWLSSQENDLLDQAQNILSGHDTLSYMVKGVDLTDMDRTAVIYQLDFSKTEVEEQLRSSLVLDGSCTFITDQNDRVIAHASLGERNIQLDALSDYADQDTISFDGVRYRISCADFEVAPWRLVTLVPDESLFSYSDLDQILLFILLAYFADEIVELILKIGGTPYAWIMSSELPTLNFADFNSVILTILGVCANGAVALIALILVLILAWNYIKLLFEAAERYVLLGVLVFTAPVAFATGAAQATSNIFKAWCRMFGGQIFLLLMNAWCLRLFITMVGTFLANPLSL